MQTLLSFWACEVELLSERCVCAQSYYNFATKTRMLKVFCVLSYSPASLGEEEVRDR